MTNKIDALVRAYARDVRMREALGDSRARYHARDHKLEAYRILIDELGDPGEAVTDFRRRLIAADPELARGEQGPCLP